jgi:dihydrofolate reductase
MKITVTNHVSLDGVMQAPADAREDDRGGFAYGGWAAPNYDDVLAAKMGEGMASRGVLLFGRRSYEHLGQAWRGRTDNPFTEVLDNTQKYVASRTLTEPLEWQNSTLLGGDAADAVALLKEQGGPDAVILGSGELIRSLHRRHLIDRYVLMIHPIVLGTGRRIFPDGSAPAQLRLVESTPTTTGVIIATYDVTGEVRPPRGDEQS